jgi:hypothetical protein
LTPPDGIDEIDDAEDDDGFEAPESPTGHVAEGDENDTPAARQLVRVRSRSNPTKGNGNVSPAPGPSSSPSSLNPPPQEPPAFSMPAVVDAPLFPNLNSKKSHHKTSTSTGTTGNYIFPSRVGVLDENDPKLRLRQRARNITQGETPYPESFSRGTPPSDESRPDFHASPALSAPAARPRSSLPAPAVLAVLNLRSTRSSLKRPHEDVEDQVSPTTLTFPASEAASTAANSRAGTPGARAAKKPRTGLRVKTS